MYLVQSYSVNNRGQLPKTIAQAAAAEGVPLSNLTCPGHERRDALAVDDFYLIDWDDILPSSKAATPISVFNDPKLAKYPLLYEKSVETHCRNGVNVLLVDGTVFWDSGCEWLKSFKATRGLDIPMPRN
jgi:hypothetical protein